MITIALFAASYVSGLVIGKVWYDYRQYQKYKRFMQDPEVRAILGRMNTNLKIIFPPTPPPPPQP